jgi:hypothetical protein
MSTAPHTTNTDTAITMALSTPRVVSVVISESILYITTYAFSV